MDPVAQANKLVATGFLHAIETGDLLTIEALLDPNFQWWVAAWGERTRAAFIEGLKRTMSGFEQREVTVTGITAEGERVAVEAYHYLFIVRDGRITRGCEYFDTAAAAAAFGPPPGAPT
jgi:uncharacterized protein